MIDPCCCQWGCNCRIRNGVCKVCEAKARQREKLKEASAVFVSNVKSG